MTEKPTALYLIVLAGIGSALFSPFSVAGGMPIAILVIPFALLAAYLHGAQEGIAVGIGSSVLAGVLIADIGNWDILIYAISAGVSVFALETFYPKQKNTLHFLLFAALGTLLFEILHDIYLGDSLLLRSENFLGSSPAGGIRLLFNVLAMGLLISLYETKADSPKSQTNKTK